MGMLLHSNEHLQIRLVLLRIGYRCSQRVGGFHGRLHRSGLILYPKHYAISWKVEGLRYDEINELIQFI
jgi:hypothetical protein